MARAPISCGQTSFPRNMIRTSVVSGPIGTLIVLTRHLGSIGVMMPSLSSSASAASMHRSSR